MAKRDSVKLERLISCIEGSLVVRSNDVRLFTDDNNKTYEVNRNGDLRVTTIDKRTGYEIARNCGNFPNNRSGYIYEAVFVKVGDKVTQYTIGRHVLVSLVFNLSGYRYFRDSNGLLDEEIVCCHLNGCKWDCRLENLEWGTNTQNLRQAHCVAGLDLHRPGVFTEKRYCIACDDTIVSCLCIRNKFVGIKNEWIEAWCNNGNSKGKVEWGDKAIDSFIRFMVGTGHWEHAFDEEGKE